MKFKATFSCPEVSCLKIKGVETFWSAPHFWLLTVLSTALFFYSSFLEVFES